MSPSKPQTLATEPTELDADALDKIAGGRKAGACQQDFPPPPPPPPKL